MSLLKEDGRTCVEDERAPGFDRRTEFRKSHGRRRRDLKRRRRDQSRKLDIEPLLRSLINDRKWSGRELVHRESGGQRHEC